MSKQDPENPASNNGQNTKTQIIIAAIAALGVVGAAVFANLEKPRPEPDGTTTAKSSPINNNVTVSPAINNSPVFNNYQMESNENQSKSREKTEIIDRCAKISMNVPEILGIDGVDKNNDALYAVLVNNSAQNNLTCVRALIAFGVGPNPKTNIYENQTEDTSPLFAAIQEGSLEAVKVLLDAGANPNLRVLAKDSHAPGISPLASSVGRGPNNDIAELLIEHGADVNAPTADNYTALARAVMANKKSLVALLIKKGAKKDITVGNKSLIQLAKDKKNQDIVSLLK